jgi:hypothetical protein
MVLAGLMSIPAYAEELHAAAVIELLQTTPLGEHVYDPDKVPGDRANEGDLPATYATVSVYRDGIDGSPQKVGRDVVGSWLVDVTTVAKTVANIRIVNDWVTSAMEGTRFTVAGRATNPAKRVGSVAAAPGDAPTDPATGLVSWSYAC